MKNIVITFLCIAFFILGLPVISVAQEYVLSGVVIDRASNAHLANVRIEINNTRLTTSTDFNGLFTIRSSQPIKQLLLTNTGYQALLMDVTDKTSPLVIKLTSARSSIDSLIAGRADIYRYIDSVMHNDQNAQMKKREETLLSGEIEMGWFSLDMNRVKRFNQFEGFYLGFGGHTNDKLLRYVSFGGYVGYGFNDKKKKYGEEISLKPDKGQHFTITAANSYDTRESGGTQFFDENAGKLEPSSFRFFYINKMDYEHKVSLSISYKINNALFYGALQRRIIDRGYDISNGIQVLSPEQYNVSGVVVGMRISPGQKFPLSAYDEDIKQSLWPVLWLQLTRGIPGMFKSTYNFSRFEGKMQLSHTFSQLGRSTMQVVGNLLQGNAPYFEYFNCRGTYGNLGIYAPGSFVTMHPNEFMVDRSMSFFFTHTFGKLFRHTLLFNPNPVWVFNYGVGKLKTNPTYYFLPFMDMHKGFAETGIQINNLLDLDLYGVGLGAYYRLGAYSNATLKENMVFKIVISFPGKD
jgi:hypothetical protein